MKLTIKTILTLFFLVHLVILQGCEYKKRSYDTVYLRLKKDITTLDPAFIVDVDGGVLAEYLYNGLVKLDKNLQVVPDLAQRWDVSDGGKHYRFYLRKDVIFTNGKKVTASCVKKSFERILDPKIASPRSWIFEQVYGKDDFLSGQALSVPGFIVVDDYTFDIILTEPFAPFLAILTMTNALIVDDYIDVDGEKIPAGTGTFKLKSWERGDAITLIKNEAYFDQKPAINAVLFRVIPEDFTAITEFENGKLDILEIPRAEFEYFTRDVRWKNSVYKTTMLNTYYLGFNCQRVPFSVKQVRKAISCALNTNAIINKYLSGRVTEAFSPAPRLLLNNSFPSGEKHTYNPEYAVKLLKEVSIDPGKLNISLCYSSDKEMEGVAELIQHDLKQIGITVQLNQLEWVAFKEKIARGDMDMFLLSWWADYPDIENFLYPVFHSSNWGSAGNRVQYKNEYFDKLVENARITSDKASQEELYGKALNILLDDAPWVCLWHRDKFMVCQPWVKHYFLPPVYTVDKGTEITLDFKNTR